MGQVLYEMWEVLLEDMRSCVKEAVCMEESGMF